jgi:RNA recognition motif-containing protein
VIGTVAVTLYVGNLPWDVTEDELAAAFGTVAQVLAARIITERHTHRSRGFGFVELEGVAPEEAIRLMNGFALRGRPLTVGLAQPRPPSH